MAGTSEIHPGPWLAFSGHVPGCGHVERDIPCQDRAASWATERPGLLVLDGRGSAALSHVGAAAALDALEKFIRESEAQLSRILDTSDEALAAVGWQGLARLIFHAAAHEQLKLADWYQMDPGAFEFTLTLALVGSRRIAWMTVGDSPMVIVRNGVSGLAGTLDSHEFANQTAFVTTSPTSHLGMQGGVLAVEGVSALVAMTDGTASRLLRLCEQIPAGAVSEIVDHFLAREWDGGDLMNLLTDPAWNQVTRDDRSLAILARKVSDAGMAAPGVGNVPPIPRRSCRNMPTTALRATGDPRTSGKVHAAPSEPMIP